MCEKRYGLQSPHNFGEEEEDFPSCLQGLKLPSQYCKSALLESCLLEC